MTSVAVSLDSLGVSKEAGTPSYWSAENHNSGSSLRQEHWSAGLKHLMLGGDGHVVKLSLDAGRAILRYREDAKMFAALRDEGLKAASTSYLESLSDPSFWDSHWTDALNDWPTYPNKSKWLLSLLALTGELDEAIRLTNGAAFIKLSVRSPKDAVLCLSHHRDYIRADLDSTTLAHDDPAVLSENVRILKVS